MTMLDNQDFGTTHPYAPRRAAPMPLALGLRRGLGALLALALAALVGQAPTAATEMEPAAVPSARWAEAIDQTWGTGLTTERKLEIFDFMWTTIDQRFAAFQGIDVDWAAMRERYRPEIAAGVSRGRFAAILSQLAIALRESHTVLRDTGVVGAPGAARAPGTPVFVARGPFNPFGACATADGDGSALIYNVAPGHPLGVQPGDRILGYDGRPWAQLYPELLAAELPIAGAWGSSPRSFEHTMVQSAPANWHLFDTVDIWKHDSGTVQHLSTAPLVAAPRSPLCSEELPVPGVPQPTPQLGDNVTWGVVAGTRIGYVYVAGWSGDAEPDFTAAIQQLTQGEGKTEGLIIDFRFNAGGNMFLSDAGLGMLFDQPVATIGFAERTDPDDHYAMRPLVDKPAEICGGEVPMGPSLYVIDMCDRVYDPRFYDAPIAVLTGPGAVSSGDQVALRMTYHPRARVFGKTTNTAFNAPCRYPFPEPGLVLNYACADAYRLDKPGDYLTHDELPVDETVWLTPADVAQGKDTVVQAAMRWIETQTR